MEGPPLESKLQRNSTGEFRYIKTALASGVSLWSEHKTKSPLRVEAVAMKQKPKSR